MCPMHYFCNTLKDIRNALGICDSSAQSGMTRCQCGKLVDNGVISVENHLEKNLF